MKPFLNDDRLLQELSDFEKLLIILLLKKEITQVEIAQALRVDNSVISRMMSPKRPGKNKAKIK